MKTLLIYIFKFSINFIYFFLKLFKTDNKKVLFITRQSDTIPLDFELLINSLKKEDNLLHIKIICKKMNKGLVNYIKYYFHIIYQMYHIATSKVCVIDSYNIAICNLKHKKSLFVLQIWHSIGKIKKSGYQTLDKESGRTTKIAKCLNMHKNYSKIVAGGSSFNKYYIESFNTTEDKILNYGLPRIDYLINNEKTIRKKILNKYNEFSNKKIILYVPTFRTYKIDIDDFIKNFDFDNCILIIKCHPNQKINIHDERVYTCDDFSSTDILTVSDYVITDYSSMCLEAAVLNKKLLFYVFDYDKYIDSNGLNLDPLIEISSCAFKDIRSITNIIKNDNYDNLAYQEFRKKYLPKKLGSSTKMITDLILKEVRK